MQIQFILSVTSGKENMNKIYTNYTMLHLMHRIEYNHDQTWKLQLFSHDNWWGNFHCKNCETSPARLNGFRCRFSVVVFPNGGNILENLLSLYHIDPMGRYIGFRDTSKLRSYPTNIDEETTVVIISGMNFCNFKSCPLDTPRNLI